MALLSRTRILANERLDLEDYNSIEDFVCSDLKALHKRNWSTENFVFSGFAATGTGGNTLSIPLANSTAIFGADDGTMYVGAPSLTALTTTNLTPSTTNFVEIYLTQDTGGASSRSFWDKTANGGLGAEFSQIVDTFIYLKANVNILTGNFSGDPDKVKICEVDVNGSGVITAIRDSRNLFFRLGRSSNIAYSHPWSSRTEPTTSQFTGADKDLKNLKQTFDALFDTIREMKGSTYWYEVPPVTMLGGFRNTGLSVLVGTNDTAAFKWTGTTLEIKDDAGSPLDSDVLAYVRLFDSTSNLQLTRQQSGAAIPIADGQVLWVEIPNPLANTTYDSVGATATNYRVTARGSVPLDQDVYWLAYREGTRLYLRGLGEMNPGEEKEINDETTKALQTWLGFDPETATSVPYTSTPSILLPNTFTTGSTLVAAISANTANINFLTGIVNTNVYEEIINVVVGVAANDNEIQGPVSIGTNITLPLDSRDSNSTEIYIVGEGQLQVYLNGILMTSGDDWLEVGTIGTGSTTIQANRAFVVGDRIAIRSDSNGGIYNDVNTATLQTAYTLGNEITTIPGLPFKVQGTATKVAEFYGDIKVTGVVDPTAIEYTPQAVSPLLSTQNGTWVNTAGDLIHSRPTLIDVNITQAVTGQLPSSAVQINIQNLTGVTLTKLTPVRIDLTGTINMINVAIEAQAEATVGLLSADVADTATGLVISQGLIQNVTVPGAVFGDALYVSKAGGITNVRPSIGVDGFVAGDFIIRMGVLAKNYVNPLQKDLLVHIQLRGQL